jgi:proteasome lid subunit RPN8/RPN11
MLSIVRVLILIRGVQRKESMVRIPEEILEQIHISAEKHYPYECCGFLVGAPGSIKGIRTAENVATEFRHRRYAISPLDFLKADEYARSSGMEVIGIYHSHPDHPASPSRYDREHALPHYLYLIVNVTKGRAGTASCWMQPSRDAGFLAEELTVVKRKLD